MESKIGIIQHVFTYAYVGHLKVKQHNNLILKKANVGISVIPETKKKLKDTQELDDYIFYCTVVSQ